MTKLMGFTFFVLAAISLKQEILGITTGVLVVPSKYIGYAPYKIARLDKPRTFWVASLVVFGLSAELIFVGYTFLAD
jgi:hypothetical protein